MDMGGWMGGWIDRDIDNASHEAGQVAEREGSPIAALRLHRALTQAAPLKDCILLLAGVTVHEGKCLRRSTAEAAGFNGGLTQLRACTTALLDSLCRVTPHHHHHHDQHQEARVLVSKKLIHSVMHRT
jgi:hypothetical protein